MKWIALVCWAVLVIAGVSVFKISSLPTTERDKLLQYNTEALLVDNTAALLKSEAEVSFLYLELLKLCQSLELLSKHFEEINTYKERKVKL